MLELGAKLLIAYLLGTALGSMILGRARGVDIRSMGSGNAGATNALRTQGKLFGLTVLLVDIVKGRGAVGGLPGTSVPGIRIAPTLPCEGLSVACAFGVIPGRAQPG